MSCYSFNNIKKFIEYIPNCLICNKPMLIAINGKTVPQIWANKDKKVYFKSLIKNGILSSTKRGIPFSVDIESNTIIEGKELFNKLILSTLYFTKQCKTCRFKIKGYSQPDGISTYSSIPKINIYNEEIYFYLKNNKEVFITKSYIKEKKLGYCIFMSVNKKTLPDLPFDFSDFTNFQQLSNRIKTILIFQ